MSMHAVSLVNVRFMDQSDVLSSYPDVDMNNKSVDCFYRPRYFQCHPLRNSSVLCSLYAELAAHAHGSCHFLVRPGQHCTLEMHGLMSSHCLHPFAFIELYCRSSSKH